MIEIDIMNHPDYIEYFYFNKFKTMPVYAYNKTTLTNLFGKHNRVFITNRKSYIWERDYRDVKFIIYTAKEKGTSISVMYDGSYEEFRADKRVGKQIISFMALLCELFYAQQI